MTSVLNPQKRFAVRLALVTGSTLATLIGAQGLISMDAQVQAAEQALTMFAGKNPNNSSVVIPLGSADSSTTAIQIAPNIIILRHPGQTNLANGTASNTLPGIRPPTPQELSAPAPIVVPGQSQIFTQPSAPIFQFPLTRSSR